MLSSPWIKSSQDEFKTNGAESKKRTRSYSEENFTPNSPSKGCEASFDNKRKKLEKVVTRGSPAIDLLKNQSQTVQNANSNGTPKRTSSIRNCKSPVLSQIADKVKLRRRKTMSEYSYSKVDDLNCEMTYSKRKKRETLASSCALNLVKETGLRTNIKEESLFKNVSGEQAKESKKSHSSIKETKMHYSKKLRALGVRKKLTRPRLASPQKKIKRTEPKTIVANSAIITNKTSCGDDKSPAKDEVNKYRRRSSKWSLGKLPKKKKRNRNINENKASDENAKTNDMFDSIKISMTQRNALLKRMNEEAAPPDQKDIFNDCDEENCYDKPEIMTLLLNLTRTINDMSGLDKFKKRKMRKTKASKARLKNNIITNKAGPSQSLKMTEDISSTEIDQDRENVEMRSAEKTSQESDSASAGGSLLSINARNVEKNVESIPSFDSGRSERANNGNNESNSTEIASEKDNAVTCNAHNKSPARGKTNKNISKSDIYERSLCARSTERVKDLENCVEISKGIISADTSNNTSENAKSNLPFFEDRNALASSSITKSGLQVESIDSDSGQTANVFCVPMALKEDTADSEKSSAAEERAKQLSLVEFLRNSIGIPERNDEDDKDTVIFNLNDVSRPLPTVERKEKPSAKLEELRRSKRKKQNVLYGSKKHNIKAKVKRKALKKRKVKPSTKVAENPETSEKSGPPRDSDFINMLKQVASLVKKLHESHQIILFLEKDMASKPELADHFKPVISAQYSNYQKHVSDHKAAILKGIDKMSKILSKSSLVTSEISKEAFLSEEEVSNVISRCVSVEDVSEPSQKKSEGDSGSKDVADAAASGAKTVRDDPVDVALSNVSTNEATSPPRSLQEPVAAHSPEDDNLSLYLAESVIASASDSGTPNVVETLPKTLIDCSDSNKMTFRPDEIPSLNVSKADSSITPPITLPHLSNGTSKRTNLSQKDKILLAKGLAHNNHPFKIAMRKAGLCLQLEENPAARPVVRAVAFPVSCLRTAASTEVKPNGKESTVTNSQRLSLSGSATDVSASCTSSAVNSSLQKEPSKFLQGFVQDFTGPLRYSAILPGTKSSTSVNDNQGTENASSFRTRFSEPGRTKQTVTQISVTKLADNSAEKVGTNDGDAAAAAAAATKSCSKSLDQNERPKMPIVKARSILEAALLKAGREMIAKKLPEKSRASKTGSNTRNVSFGQDFQRASPSVVPRKSVEPEEASPVLHQAKESGPSTSKALNKDLSQTSEFQIIQKKAIAQLIELSKKLVESRSLLRQSGGMTRPHSVDSVAREETIVKSGGMANGTAAELRPEKSCTPQSKQPVDDQHLPESDTSPIPDSQASTVAAPRRSKRFQKNDVTPDPSPGAFEDKQEKETPKTKGGQHCPVAVIKTEKEIVEENNDATVNGPSREESSSGENQSDDDSSDTYFDLDKVKKELEDVHGLIHFICAENKCMNPGTEICTGCQSVLYCSRKCQARHWNRKHYKHCEELKKMTEERKKNKITGI